MAASYERQPAESDPAFEAFALYRDMGSSRNVRAVAAQLSKSEQLIKRWCTGHRWVDRAALWDMEIDRKKRLVDLKEIEKMRRRHIRAAVAMTELGQAELDKMLKTSARKARNGELTAADVRKLIAEGTKLERLVRGEPGEILQHTVEGAVDLSIYNTEELKEIRRLKEKARRAQLEESEDDDG